MSTLETLDNRLIDNETPGYLTHVRTDIDNYCNDCWNHWCFWDIKQFFINPKLQFKLIKAETILDNRWTKLTENALSFYPRRRFLNVLVRNEGRKLASNCEASLKVLNKDGCNWLSTSETDIRLLMWQNGKTQTTIKNKPDERVFCLAFSQEKLTQEQINLIDPVYCNIAKKNVKCVSWIGTERALKRTEYADPDGMCEGEFTVRVDLVMDYGKTVSKKFKIVVGKEWTDLNAIMLDDSI